MKTIGTQKVFRGKGVVIGGDQPDRYLEPSARGRSILGSQLMPHASSVPGRFQHSQSHRSQAGKTTRPTSLFRIPQEITRSPSLRTRSTIALQLASTPCTWAWSPPATMSTSTLLPVPTANSTMKQATTQPPPTPGCEGRRHEALREQCMCMHTTRHSFLFFFFSSPANLVC